jgi:general secretion pathway protein G
MPQKDKSIKNSKYWFRPILIIIVLVLICVFFIPKMIKNNNLSDTQEEISNTENTEEDYRVSTAVNKAIVLKAKSDIMSFETAIKMYRLDNGVYPTTKQGLQALVKKTKINPIPENWHGPYLDVETLPKDPWGNSYIYLSPGENKTEYEIISLGADGQPGGEGFNADIKKVKKSLTSTSP